MINRMNREMHNVSFALYNYIFIRYDQREKLI